MAHPRHRPARRSGAFVVPCFALLFGYVGVQGSTLLSEYRKLRGEWIKDVEGRVVGYPGVTPIFTWAQGPSDWLHDEGDSTLLWARWDNKAERHLWFRVGKGHVTADRLSHPIGKDTARAIDKPRLEARGGPIWEAIHPEDLVATGEYLGVPVAYPFGVLDKTFVVNDEIHTQPILVVFSPLAEAHRAAEAFYPVLNGKRLTMGHSGYLWDGRPLLYDRQHQGLWASADDGLKAVAGPHRGEVLRRIAQLRPVAWKDWRDGNPDGRLVAGAIRADQKNLKP